MPSVVSYIGFGSGGFGRGGFGQDYFMVLPDGGAATTQQGAASAVGAALKTLTGMAATLSLGSPAVGVEPAPVQLVGFSALVTSLGNVVKWAGQDASSPAVWVDITGGSGNWTEVSTPSSPTWTHITS